MFITNIDGKEMAKVAEISKQPSKDDPRLWAEGMFEIKYCEDGKSNKYKDESVYWSKLYLAKDQAVAIKTKRTSGSQLWEGNIVDLFQVRSARLVRLRLASQPSANVVTTPKSTPKRSRKPRALQQNAARNEETNVTNEPNKEGKIFAGLNFILTTAPRSNKESYFNKGQFRDLIQKRGGKLIDDLKTLHDTENTFLISDAHYRTEKYFHALSLSIPCVSYKWIIECVNANEVVPFENLMLPSGETPLGSGIIYEWTPLKGTLLHGRKVMVYSNAVAPIPRPNEKLVSFGGVWSPIVENLGAELIEPFESGGPISQKLALINSNEIDIDILLTDITCEDEVADAVESKGGVAVSSDWLMDAMITGEMANPDTNLIFCYDYVELNNA